jgi:hypothetical protein
VPVRRLILELDEAPAESIAGSLIDESGRASTFVGWLGLAAALQATTEPGTAGRPTGAGRSNPNPSVEET